MATLSATTTPAAKRTWRVFEWMSPIALSIRPHTELASAFCKMKIDGIRHLPVIDDGNLVGLVSDRDLRSANVAESDDWRDFYDIDDDRQVQQVMTRNVVTVEPSDPLEKALEILKERGFGALPVVDDGVVVGMLSSQDLLGALDEALAEIRLAQG